MGGTAGSHILTANAQLQAKLGGKGVYAEAKDGRPFFVLPFGAMTLIGTTDIRFAGDPRNVRASEAELAYLVESVNEIFPDIKLTQQEIALHYCGVRPLPKANSKDPGAVTRDHKILEHENVKVPMLSLVGGKLTTARALAQEAADKIIEQLHLRRVESTEDRPYPGAFHLVEGTIDAGQEKSRLVKETGFSRETIDAVWSLFGDESAHVLDECRRQWPGDGNQLLPGTQMPQGLARYAVRHEWAHTIDDVISRRLMLLFQGSIQTETLQRLGEILAAEGAFPASQATAQVTACRNALADRYGLQIS